VNNLLGMVAHLLLLGMLLAVRPGLLRDFVDHHLPSLPGWLIAAILLVITAAWAAPAVRRRVSTFAHNVLVSLRRMRPSALLRALLLAVVMTATYTLLLFAGARSVGVHIGLLQTFIVFSLGMLTSTVTPTPGGLVGAEAGLYAGFVAYDVDAVPAGAAVLLFRLVSYWLPLLPGAVALLLAKRHKLL
jgi:uncharacterized protein (TIRG00374 family)